MIKAVLLDVDDTLLDHNTAIRNAASSLFDKVITDKEHERQIFIERWISLNREWYQKFYAKQVTFQESGRGKLREAFSIYDYQFSDEEADSLLSDYWEEYVEMCQLFNDVNDCFKQLQQYKIGIVTDGQENQQVAKIKHCNIYDAMDVVVTAETAGFAKPAFQIFAYACAKLGVSEKECVYIGDNLELDAIAANNAGMIGIWLNRQQTKLESSPQNVKTINRLTEVLEILQKLAD